MNNFDYFYYEYNLKHASIQLFLVIRMAEGVACVDGNDSFQNQTDEAAATSRSSRRASKAAVSAWAELKKRKSPRGNPAGGYAKRLLKQSEKSQLKEMQKRTRLMSWRP